MPNPRRPQAAQVLRPSAGLGLSLPGQTTLQPRQWDRPKRRTFQVVPTDWRTAGPVLSFGTAPETGQGGDGSGTGTPCEDCT